MTANQNDIERVSVIVITYNSAKYVVDTLESIKAQSYRNLELIVSDDASRDTTVALVEAWFEKNRMHFAETKLIVSNRNTGIPANCNRGLKAATGRYIKILAGDDMLLENCIEDNLQFLSQHKVDIALSGMVELTQDGLQRRLDLKLQEEMVAFVNMTNNQLRQYVRRPIFLNSPTLLYKSSVFEALKSFDEEFFFIEDQPTMIRALHQGFKLGYLEKNTVIYRTHGESVSHTGNYTRLMKDLKHCLFKYRLPHTKCTDWITLLHLLSDWIVYEKQLNQEYTVRKWVFKILYRMRPIR